MNLDNNVKIICCDTCNSSKTHSNVNNVNSSEHITPNHQISSVIGDCGATGSFFRYEDTSFLTNIKKHNIGSKSISVKLPNNDIMTSSHSADLNIDGLSQSAMKVHLFPDLNNSLLGFGPLCDDGCIITLNNTTVTVVKNGNVVMTGNRDGPGKLWLMDLSRSQPHSSSIQEQSQLHNVSEISNFSELTAAVNIQSAATIVDEKRGKNSTMVESKKWNSVHTMPKIISSSIERIINFYHGAMGSPPISTFINAIKHKFIIFPGINVNQVRKHLHPSPFTDKGHMKLLRQGLNSTKINNYFDFNDNIVGKVLPTNSQKILISMRASTHRLHLDATGQFKYADNDYDYDLIFYSEDSNYIHVEVMKGRSTTSYVNAITNGINFSQIVGYKLILFVSTMNKVSLYENSLNLLNNVNLSQFHHIVIEDVKPKGPLEHLKITK